MPKLEIKDTQQINKKVSRFPGKKIIRELEKVLGQKIKAKEAISWNEKEPSYYSVIRVFELSLYNCKIKSLTPLIPFFKKMSELEFLDLGNNQISDISPLKELKNLEKLNLNGNQITDISPLKELKKLKALNLSGNRINKISELGLKKNLYLLDLSGNQITDIATINKLPRTCDIYLSKNSIKNIEVLKKRTFWSLLDLRNNKIEFVDEKWLKKIPRSNNLFFDGNPITNIPPSVLKLEFNSLKKYFHERDKGTILAYESKLIVVGNGRVGKTSIIKRWLDNAFDPNQPSTHAIQLRTYELKKMAIHLRLDHLLLNIWDFGGQDIYQETHKLFMRSSAVFLLVWDAQTEKIPEQKEVLSDGRILYYKNYSLIYWLSYIKTLSKNSPVILVQTNRDRDGKRIGILSEEQIKEYNVCDIVSVECSKSAFDGFKGLEEAIEEVVFKQIKQHSIEIPEKWYRIRNQLIELQRQQIKQLGLTQFYMMCKKEGLDKSSIDGLLSYLHNSGIVLYPNGLLNAKIIIDQAWAINAIYALFNRTGRFATETQNGQFTGKDLQKVWHRYDSEKQELFVNFMEECEICFEIDKEQNAKLPFSNRIFVAPQLLSKDKPEDLKFIFRKKNGIYYSYRHKFLHAAVIQRFIVRVGFMTDIKKMWQNGVLLMLPEGMALVEAFPDKNEILIRLEDINPKALLSKIRNEMNEINKEEAGIEEFVSLDGKTFIDLKSFKNRPLHSDTIQAENGSWVNVDSYHVFLDHNDKQLFDKRRKKMRKPIPQKRKIVAELQQAIGSKCPFCNNTDVGHFEIHHVDENPNNNIKSNLLLVCPTCHSKINKGDIKQKTVIKIKSELREL